MRRVEARADRRMAKMLLREWYMTSGITSPEKWLSALIVLSGAMSLASQNRSGPSTHYYPNGKHVKT